MASARDRLGALRGKASGAAHRLAVARAGGSGGTAATVGDLDACYRLLLGRQPDEGGRAHLLEELPGLSVEDLVRRFFNSAEFRSRPLVLETMSGEADDIEAVSVEGFDIFVRIHDQDIGRAIKANRVYEPHVSTVMRSLVDEGDIVVDVGANVGWFTLLAASLVGEKGRVHAVEANAKNVALLHRSVRRNGFNERVQIHPVAASDRADTLVLAPQAGSNGIVDEGWWFASQFDVQLVHALALDELLGSLDRLDLVKMDIEGGEYRALQGFRRLLERFRPHVLTEYSPALLQEVSKVDPSELLRFWDELGYHARLLLPNEAPSPVELTPGALKAAQERAKSDHVDLHLHP